MVAEKNLILLENWPANSPDLSPIEQIWGIAKRFFIQRFGMVTPIANEELETAVNEAYREVEPRTIAILTLSVKYRIRLCVARHGGFVGDAIEECCRPARVEFDGLTTIQTTFIIPIRSERGEHQGNEGDDEVEDLSRLPSFRNSQ